LYQGKNAEAEADFKKAFQLDGSLKKRFQPLIDEAKSKSTTKP
jgi:hypothetical protein